MATASRFEAQYPSLAAFVVGEMSHNDRAFREIADHAVELFITSVKECQRELETVRVALTDHVFSRLTFDKEA